MVGKPKCFEREEEKRDCLPETPKAPLPVQIASNHLATSSVLRTEEEEEEEPPEKGEPWRGTPCRKREAIE